ncbi:Cro/C1-type HTH DNA-binding domain protein [Clostridium sp. MSTE9]|nr:Cro/C1-type HTH DNA-binding domain protein [Clostridium sp. MSTE9]
MTRNYLARKIDSRFEVVDKWYKNRVEKIDIDILARICFVLECEVEDIIEYTK